LNEISLPSHAFQSPANDVDARAEQSDANQRTEQPAEQMRVRAGHQHLVDENLGQVRRGQLHRGGQYRQEGGEPHILPVGAHESHQAQQHLLLGAARGARDAVFGDRAPTLLAHQLLVFERRRLFILEHCFDAQARLPKQMRQRAAVANQLQHAPVVQHCLQRGRADQLRRAHLGNLCQRRGNLNRHAWRAAVQVGRAVGMQSPVLAAVFAQPRQTRAGAGLDGGVIDAQGQQGLIRQHEPALAEPPVWRQIGRQRELDVRSAHPLLDGRAHKLRQPSLRRIHTPLLYLCCV
jgi:hypothetical protein